jgi:hypothetical protein
MATNIFFILFPKKNPHLSGRYPLADEMMGVGSLFYKPLYSGIFGAVPDRRTLSRNPSSGINMRAGLLTRDSTYYPMPSRPGYRGNGDLRISSSHTAAGPFPFIASDGIPF